MNIARRRKKLPSILLYLASLAYVTLLLILARLGFFVWVSDKLAQAPFSDTLKALYTGFRFDARIAAIITFPLGFMLTVRSIAKRMRHFKNLLFIFYALIFFILWTIYAFDAGFFAYLGERLNSTIIELAEDTRDGVHMVLESYPILWLATAVALFSLLCAWPIRRIAGCEIREIKSKAFAAAIWLSGFVIFAVASYGQISSNLFPLRWSHAYFSTNTYITALGLNPLQNLYDTWQNTKDNVYDPEKTREVYPLMSSILQVDNPDMQTLNFLRFTPASDNDKKPNVIIIIMESFSYAKTSFAKGDGDPTPRLRELANESVLFRQFFANARTTARGVFSIITGVPDVTESSTGSRNQQVIDQRIIANEFEGYDRFYLLGGNTAWANIRSIIAHNIKNVRILEESYWKAPNADVWGVSDYHLLMEAHDLFCTLKERPFLAVIQTASFHKPYTIPKNIPGFKRRKLDEKTAANYGFISEDEYNSMRYMDFSVGEFMRRAKESGYYNDTVFIMCGDHGIYDHSLNTTGAYNIASLRGWHVPLIVHAPGRLAPGVREDASSQVDVFPTAAGLAGIAYNNWTMGRDLFSATQNQKRGAFISGKSNSPIRLVLDGFCFFDNRDGVRELYRLSDTEPQSRKREFPELFATMGDMAEAMQISSNYLLYNNNK